MIPNDQVHIGGRRSGKSFAQLQVLVEILEEENQELTKRLDTLELACATRDSELAGMATRLAQMIKDLATVVAGR
jgi:hypothetical protein